MLTKNFRIPQGFADDLCYTKLRNSGESTEESGWYVVNTQNNVLAQYDAANGKILVKVKNSTGKAGSVKVNFMFKGQPKPISKTFSVGIKR